MNINEAWSAHPYFARQDEIVLRDAAEAAIARQWTELEVREEQGVFFAAGPVGAVSALSAELLLRAEPIEEVMVEDRDLIHAREIDGITVIGRDRGDGFGWYYVAHGKSSAIQALLARMYSLDGEG